MNVLKSSNNVNILSRRLNESWENHYRSIFNSRTSTQVMLFSLFEEPGRGGDIQEQYVYVPPPPQIDIENLRNDTAMATRVSKK